MLQSTTPLLPRLNQHRETHGFLFLSRRRPSSPISICYDTSPHSLHKGMPSSFPLTGLLEEALGLGEQACRGLSVAEELVHVIHIPGHDGFPTARLG